MLGQLSVASHTTTFGSHYPITITIQSFSVFADSKCSCLNVLKLFLALWVDFSPFTFSNLYLLWFKAFPVSQMSTTSIEPLEHLHILQTRNGWQMLLRDAAVSQLFPEVFLCWQFLGWHWHLVGLATKEYTSFFSGNTAADLQGCYKMPASNLDSFLCHTFFAHFLNFFLNCFACRQKCKKNSFSVGVWKMNFKSKVWLGMDTWNTILGLQNFLPT